MDAPIIMRMIPSQPNGSEISSQPGSSRQETLTSDQSSMSGQTTCGATPNVTSSQALADGATPCGSRDGLTTDLFGLEVVHANRSAVRGRGSDLKTLATSGPTGTLSFSNVGLQSFLENRLKALLPGCGLTLFTLTWKQQATPSGRQYCLLRASAPRSVVTGLGSWQTPTTRDGKGESGRGNRTKRGKPGKPHVANLCDQLVDLGRRDLVRSSRFRCHLMGYPTSWEDAAPTVTPSCRKSQRTSSSRLTKQSEPSHD